MATTKPTFAKLKLLKFLPFVRTCNATLEFLFLIAFTTSKYLD